MKLEAEAADDAEDAAAVAKGRGCWGGVGRRGGGGGRRFAASPGGVSSVALMAKATLPPLFSLGSCVRFRLCRGLVTTVFATIIIIMRAACPSRLAQPTG